MNVKSRNNNIKLQTNPIYEQNSLNSQYITYNKPLFIKMQNESNNIYKTSTSSTKINTCNIESPFDLSNKKDKINSNIIIKEFELDKNYSQTTNNFFVKDINNSLSSNEENNNNLFETFTPGKGSLFLKDEEEQFTPYLGQKNNEKNILNDNKENNNYSNIFNNSKEIITRSSLNLKNHLDEKLSNHSKSINKYQKLSFYQKKINRGSKTNNIYINKNRYNLVKNISKANINNNNNNSILIKKIILIQSIIRGYIYRINLYNKLKNFTCITILFQAFNKIILRRKKYIFNGWIYLLKKYKTLKRSCLMKSNRISLYIKRSGNNNNFIYKEKIKELVQENNNLQIKLSGFVINNSRLKKDLNNCRDLESKYNNLLIQFDKLQVINNSIIKENYKLVNELNSIKKKEKNNLIISPQQIIYFQINKERKNNKGKNKPLVISKKVNNISILNNNKNSKSLSNPNLIKNSYIMNDLKKLDLNEDKRKDKDYRLIIVKKINFIIKKIPKEKIKSLSDNISQKI